MLYDLLTSLLFLALVVVVIAVVVKYLTTPRQKQQCQHCAHVNQEQHSEAHHRTTSDEPAA